MEIREIRSLLRPEAFPEPTATVELRQTHVSYLLMTDTRVYKIKKPVNLGFLDFTDRERRRFYCNEEVRLNRRLSPEIYLGVVEIRQTHDGFTIAGDGPVADYAVEMVRMPEERMLHRLLAAGNLTEGDIRGIARKVAEFHRQAGRGAETARFGSRESISGIWEENFSLAAGFTGETISAADLELIRGWVASYLDDQAWLFAERVKEGFIRECDGDLHMENICLGERIWIFDCIEFNDRFRYIDTAADIAFLIMDLEFHDRPDLAAAFLDEYREASGDEGCVLLVDFYKVYRAFVRGKVASIKLHDSGVAGLDRDAARDAAIAYFRLARGYIVRKRLVPAMILVGGLMGSGKSTVSRLLGRELGIPVVSSDRVRKELFGGAPATGGQGSYRGGLYSREADRATYDELLVRALDLLRGGGSVIIDATFCRKADRERFREAADAAGVSFALAMTDCPEDEIRRRLAERETMRYVESDGRLEVFAPHRDAFEHPGADEPCIAADTGGELRRAVDALIDGLGVGK